MELVPGKPLTRDQLLMLQQDNVAGADMPGLQELGIVPTPVELVVPGLSAAIPAGRRQAQGAAGGTGRAAQPICHFKRRTDVATAWRDAARGAINDRRCGRCTICLCRHTPARCAWCWRRSGLPFDLRTEKVWERRR